MNLQKNKNKAVFYFSWQYRHRIWIFFFFLGLHANVGLYTELYVHILMIPEHTGCESLFCIKKSGFVKIQNLQTLIAEHVSTPIGAILLLNYNICIKLQWCQLSDFLLRFSLHLTCSDSLLNPQWSLSVWMEPGFLFIYCYFFTSDFCLAVIQDVNACFAVRNPGLLQ